MALINIGASNADDTFYRYKMPKLQAKIEGRGNGIKTNLVNMVDVAKALDRPASYTTKYFGYELGAQSKFDEKTGTSIVNGAHDLTKLAALLENFIKKFVQCYNCGNPETIIMVSKQQTLQLKCAACGGVSDVDMRDKLTSFILKFPPEDKKKGKGKDKQLRRAEKERIKAGEAADEEAKKVKKGSKKKEGENGKISKKKGDSDEDKDMSPEASQKGEEDEDDDDGVEWQTDVSEAAAQARIKEQLTAATSEMVMVVAPDVVTVSNGNGNGNGNGVHTKSKEVSVKVEEVQAAVVELSLHDQLLDELKAYASNHDAAALVSYAMAKDEPKETLMMALFETLADGKGKGLVKVIGKKTILGALAKVVTGDTAQYQLMTAAAIYCGKTAPDAMKELPLVLKVLYDADVLEEDVILAWYNDLPEMDADKGLVSAVSKAVLPFVDWLKNAEAESDEED